MHHAENPIRNGTLPGNIVQVAEVIIEAARCHAVTDLQAQLDYTLALVVSGRIARECGVQAPLTEFLVGAGANADGAMRTAAAHRELDACRTLLASGADCSLLAAAALGLDEVVSQAVSSATAAQRGEALIVAATNAQHRCVRILLDRGADANAPGPEGLHAHCAPLHLAVDAGCVSTVCALVTRGADLEVRDRLHNATPSDWAVHLGRAEVLEFLDRARSFVSAIQAVREGHVEALRRWLTHNAGQVNDTLGDNPRTLLHFATDWPGGRPRVAETIDALVAAGADVDARCLHPGATTGETPLHWAASSDDVAAAEALIRAGATLDIDGGCIANGAPLFLAVIFQKWRVARLLLAAGADYSLPLVAGLGDLERMAGFFDASGRYQGPPDRALAGPVGHDDADCDPSGDPPGDPQALAQQDLDAALRLAARGGHLEACHALAAAGARPNVLGPVGTTALDDARDNGHAAVADWLLEVGGLGAKDLEPGPLDEVSDPDQ